MDEITFQRLRERNGVVHVGRDQVRILRPQDDQSAIGIQESSAHHCLILMGTGPTSAIIVALISTALPGSITKDTNLSLSGTKGIPSEIETRYARVLRQMATIFISEPELFQLPLAWGVFGRDVNSSQVNRLLAEQAFTVFGRLRVRMRISLYEAQSADGLRSQSSKDIVVVARHKAELPEIYVGKRLVYPKDYSGSLALEYNRLGLRQVGHNPGDDGDEGKNDDGGDEKRG